MSTFLEKQAANRLGKEVLKKWLAGSKTPAAQSFSGKVVDSLMGPKVHPKATGADRIKFLARGGNEATGKATISAPKVKVQPAVVTPPPASPAKATVEAKKIQPTLKNKIAPRPVSKNPQNNKFLKRVSIGAGVAGAAGLVGYGVKKLMNQGSSSKH